MKNIFTLLFVLLIISWLTFLNFGCSLPRTEAPQNAPTAESSDNLNLVEIRNIEVTKSSNNEDAVFAEVKNVSDKIIVGVRVRTFLLDKNGKPLAEQDFPPIFQGAMDSNASEPLKPNYARKFGFKVSAPSEWSGKVKMSVISVRVDD